MEVVCAVGVREVGDHHDVSREWPSRLSSASLELVTLQPSAGGRSRPWGSLKNREARRAYISFLSELGVEVLVLEAVGGLGLMRRADALGELEQPMAKAFSAHHVQPFHQHLRQCGRRALGSHHGREQGTKNAAKHHAVQVSVWAPGWGGCWP